MKFKPKRIRRPKPRSGLPWLTDDQIKKVVSYLKPTDSMLEFGCGGSTTYFSKYVEKYYSIEHMSDWFDSVRVSVPDNVTMVCVPPNYEGGDPGGENSDIPQLEYDKLLQEHPYAYDFSIKRYWQFRDYVNQVGNFETYFDKILIDGRARSFAAFKSHSYLKEDGIVFIDNFYDRLKWHGDVMSLYEEIDGANSMIVLRKKCEAG